MQEQEERREKANVMGQRVKTKLVSESEEKQRLNKRKLEGVR